MESTSTRSAEWYERACRVLPAGVNSPVRAFRAVGGIPPFVRKAAGSTLFDEDDRSYIDYCLSFGPLLLGHAHPEVVAAVQEAISEGLTFGAPTHREVLLAERIVAAYPGLDMVRFVSSGTEAVMSAIRLARGFTGRDKIVKFEGCYHGHADHLLVAAGSGLATFGTPSSAGVPKSFAEQTLVLPLDDPEGIEALMESHGHEIAAVILEPVPANAGLLLQTREYLELLRKLTQRTDSLLVFDEVISGFRLGMGGAASHYGITPDLATFGKVIGGGMPVGAFGGRKDILERIAPLGDVYQAGTLSGNPVAMAAGEATLRLIEELRVHEKLESLTEKLSLGMEAALHKTSVPGRVGRIGSIFWLNLQGGEALPRRFDEIRDEAATRYGFLHRRLLNRGVYLAPSAYEVGFLSVAHTEEQIERTCSALEEALAEMVAEGDGVA